MKITLIVVGKTQSKDLQDTILDYIKRLSHYTSFEMIDVHPSSAKASEGKEEKLLKVLEKFEKVILLDEKGKEHTSVDFSKRIEMLLNASTNSVAFVIGGPFGFSEEVKKKATGIMSLSQMTFPHDLVRVIFLEQLYRAFTILKNEKYHHE